MRTKQNANGFAGHTGDDPIHHCNCADELAEAAMHVSRRLERWKRLGIEAGVKGRDKDFDKLAFRLQLALTAFRQ